MHTVYISPLKGDMVMTDVADMVLDILESEGKVEPFSHLDMTPTAAKNASNKLGVDTHIALRTNKTGGRGVTVYYSGSDKGLRLAHCIREEMCPLLPTVDRGVKVTTVDTEIVNTKGTACIVEIAYIDKTADAEWLNLCTERIARAVANGLYLNHGMACKDVELDEQLVGRRALVETSIVDIRSTVDTASNGNIIGRLVNQSEVQLINKQEDGPMVSISFGKTVGFVNIDSLKLL